MELADALRQLAAPIVIIDDHYAAPDVSNIDGHRMGKLAGVLRNDKSAHRSIKALLGAKSLSPVAAARRATSPKFAAQLWKTYEKAPSEYRYLDPLFEDMLHERGPNTARLKQIENFCRKCTGKEPLTYRDLGTAELALRSCAVAFVDFNLNGTDVQRSIALHRQYAESYRAKFSFAGYEWPKIVVLISSRMPNQHELVEFREATQLRVAFFDSLRKAQITQQRLAEEMSRWSANYIAAAELDRYLKHAGEAVDVAANEVRGNIERLETHDLAMLNAFRLTAEQETIQSYLTWLIAESLASRLRYQDKLQTPLLTERINNAPLDGKLMPNSVLFEMFADVATCPPTGSAISFGDVFAVVKAREPDPNNDHWVLAISPACDLVRCESTYDVLCVRGTASKAASSLKSIMAYKNALFGKGSHVMRYQGKRGALKYTHVQWDTKQGLHSLKAGKLQTATVYQRVARLSDSFAQEIKELTLSHASRVGIPVDPAFAIAASATVRIKLKRPGRDGQIIEHEQALAGEHFTCAVISRARVRAEGKADTKTDTMLVLTPQFVDWLQEDFLDQAQRKLLDQPLPMLDEFVKFLSEWSCPRMVSGSHSSATEFNGRVIVYYGVPTPESGCPENKLEIYLNDQEQ